MRNNWKKSIELLLVSEGPETNISAGEPGGASKYGVSVAALSDLRKRQGKSPATIDMVSSLTEQDAEDFYQQVTGAACRFDELAPGVDYVMLDVTANLGPTGIARLMECVLGRWPLTDKLTDEMVAAINAAHADTMIYAIGSAWLAKKRESPSWTKNSHGWRNRMVRVRGDALNMMQGA